MADKQQLLLVPGLICDAAVWEFQIAHLSEVAEISVPPVTRGDTMAEMARIVLDRAPASFALAGFSMGGYVALEMLRQAPQRITKLALLDTSARDDSPKKAEWRRSVIAACKRGEFTDVIEGMMPILLHANQRSGPLPEFVRTMANRVGSEVYLRRQYAIDSRQDSRDLLRAYPGPVRAICGRQDGMSTIEEHEEIAALAKYGRCSIIEDCGHMTILERPHAATALLRDWLLYN
ncbi:MAG TPA: alpha/beta hydrolase [Pseudolabrys sp.]|nr:alpha/beta hydrolase [Pseudolabrys sp.]